MCALYRHAYRYINVSNLFYITLSFLFAIILSFSAQIPLLIDGFTQKWKWRSSTNLLRLTTGVLSGNGMGLFISSSVIWILS